MIIYKRKVCISGEVVADAKTKELVKRLKKNQIAILQHLHLDGVAAKDLIRQKPQVVVNFSNSITSEIPAKGANLLLSAGILLIDVTSNHSLFDQINDGMKVELSLREGTMKCPEINQSFTITPITTGYTQQKLQLAYQNYNQLFAGFLNNTLEYANQERNAFINSFPMLNLNTELHNKSVVIVVRGSDAVEDFFSIQSYIRKEKPILIGVDGGADIIIEQGFVPDIVIGDMDSVSDVALATIKDRIIHSYPTGRAPGLARLQNMNLDYRLLPFIGTSEDVAILLAYEHGVNKIVLVGSHTHMLDFLEKGREGMASTFLTRMKVGHLIVDVKGIHSLFNS